jgi:Protein of unknown function (DUF1579)
MKKIVFTLLAILILTGTYSQNAAGDDAAPATMKMPDSATMMKNWQAFMTPGEMHKKMAKWDGKWDADITMWMAPGAPPQKTKATAVNKMVMNGLYQESIHTGNMMGMAFSGKSTLGYDNLRKVFVSTWIDNMGSGIMYLEGPMDETGKTIMLKGKMTDPGTGFITDVRETMSIKDDNTQVMEMFVGMPGGKEMKTMEIKFTRIK